MDKTKRDWIKLNMLPNIGALRGSILLEELHEPNKIFSASFNTLKNIEGINPKLAKEIVATRDSVDIDREIELIEKENIDIITMQDPTYPEHLRHIYAPPLVLYVKGRLFPEDYYGVAIVGTRRASFYGRENAEKFGFQLAERGFTVVSGLARGIDTYAHRGALKAGGRTIAVLGCGVNIVYPSENDKLLEEISKQGAVISEFPMNTQPISQNFPVRNRIISGLSLGVVVVEAAKKSGALITASFALEQGKEVFSVPGRVDVATSRGTLGLIKEGAKLVEGVDDILEELQHPNIYSDRISSKVKTEAKIFLTDTEKCIFGILSKKPKHIDQIKYDSDMDFGRISDVLLHLQLRGVVRELPGKKFIRV